MKKLFTFLLISLMAISLVPVGAFAQTDTDEGTNTIMAGFIIEDYANYVETHPREADSGVVEAYESGNLEEFASAISDYSEEHPSYYSNSPLAQAYEEGDIAAFETVVNETFEPEEIAVVIYTATDGDTKDASRYVDNQSVAEDVFEVIAELKSNGVPLDEMSESHLTANHVVAVEKSLDDIKDNLSVGALQDLKDDVSQTSAVVKVIEDKGTVEISLGGQSIVLREEDLQKNSEQITSQVTAALANTFATQVVPAVTNISDVSGLGTQISGVASQYVSQMMRDFGVNAGDASKHAQQMVNRIQETHNKWFVEHQGEITDYAKEVTQFASEKGYVPSGLTIQPDFSTASVQFEGGFQFNQAEAEKMHGEMLNIANLPPAAQRAAAEARVTEELSRYGGSVPQDPAMREQMVNQMIGTANMAKEHGDFGGFGDGQDGFGTGTFDNEGGVLGGRPGMYPPLPMPPVEMPYSEGQTITSPDGETRYIPGMRSPGGFSPSTFGGEAMTPEQVESMYKMGGEMGIPPGDHQGFDMSSYKGIMDFGGFGDYAPVGGTGSDGSPYYSMPGFSGSGEHGTWTSPTGQMPGGMGMPYIPGGTMPSGMIGGAGTYMPGTGMTSGGMTGGSSYMPSMSGPGDTSGMHQDYAPPTGGYFGSPSAPSGGGSYGSYTSPTDGSGGGTFYGTPTPSGGTPPSGDHSGGHMEGGSMPPPPPPPASLFEIFKWYRSLGY